MKLSLPILLFSLALLVGCSATTMRSHPTLTQELERIDSVVIAPPIIEVQLMTLTGENESIPEKEEEISNYINEHIRLRLVEQGFDVVEFDFENAKLEDPGFAYTITKLQEGYDEVKEELQIGRALSNAKASELKSYIGDAIHTVQAKTSADAILITRFSGFQKSGGYVAKDAGTSILIGILSGGTYIPIQQASGAGFEAALVDGYTGELLWADSRNGALSGALSNAVFAKLPIDVDPVLASDPQAQPSSELENVDLSKAEASDLDLNATVVE
ncbi:hypothetical protein [Aurantivibrio plasticivorans]